MFYNAFVQTKRFQHLEGKLQVEAAGRFSQPEIEGSRSFLTTRTSA